MGALLLTFLLHERSLEIIKISKWFIACGIILLFNEFFHHIENIYNLNTFIKISKQIFYTKYVSTYLTSTFIFAIFEIIFRKRKFDIKYLNFCLNLLIFVALFMVFNMGIIKDLFADCSFVFYVRMYSILFYFYFSHFFVSFFERQTD